MKSIDAEEFEADFSRVLEPDQTPTLITQHGEPAFVLMSFEHYKSLKKPRSLWDALKNYKWDDVELEREHVSQRELDL